MALLAFDELGGASCRFGGRVVADREPTEPSGRPGEFALRTLARRAMTLEEEVTAIDKMLKTLVAETAPELAVINGVGTDVATALLVAAGDNPERLRSEATFAHLCGVAPLDASSGNRNDTVSTVEVTARRTRRCGTS